MLGGQGSQFVYAMICASNQNRSMAAHVALKEKGFLVESFGTNTQVKLPGPSIDRPNVFDFGVPYQFMHDTLIERDSQLYTRNGILSLLERNMGVKTAPERFQDSRKNFDVIVTFERRVFDAVLDDLRCREPMFMKPLLICNLEIRDTQEEALLGAAKAVILCDMIEREWPNDLKEFKEDFRSKSGIDVTVEQTVL
mmetsp:Transcript_25362/g.63620  ORF Transcript_25362/g.63620 Transcript_25362/m.63620 type:complete len:196 (-) Transcript_25362:769-1356(-)